MTFLKSASKITHWLLVYEYTLLGNRGKTGDILIDLPTA